MPSPTITINWAEIETRLKTAVETGMDATINQMSARARNLAPVRKVFKGQKDITRGEKVNAKFPGGKGNVATMAETPTGSYRIFRRPPPVMSEAEMAVTKGAPMTANEKVMMRRRVQSQASPMEKPTGHVREGVFTPAGPGQQHGSWAGAKQRMSPFRGFPQISLIAPEAKVNVRGRYEMKSGRAFYGGPEGTTLGGRLRDSIEPGDIHGRWGGKYELYLNAGSEQVYYAIYQELGTSHNRAHPFLRPALDEASKYYQRYVERSIQAVKL